MKTVRFSVNVGHISRCNLEMVRDRGIVTVVDYPNIMSSVTSLVIDDLG